MPLNNTVGGFNRYAVDHGINLGAKLVWMPTFSAENHIKAHQEDTDFDKKFPTTKEAMLAPTPLKVVNQNGNLIDEIKFILDLIAKITLFSHQAICTFQKFGSCSKRL